MSVYINSIIIIVIIIIAVIILLVVVACMNEGSWGQLKHTELLFLTSVLHREEGRVCLLSVACFFLTYFVIGK